MKLSDLIADVRVRIQEPAASTWEDADILRWLNQALDDVSEVASYELIKQVSTVPGQGSYPLPTDSLRDGLRRITWAVPQGGLSAAQIPLQNISRDEYDRLVMYGAAGSTWGPMSFTPCYTVWGGQIYLLPIPTLGGNNDLTFYYYGFLPHLVLTKLDDAPAIPQNRHEMLVLYAVARCQEMIEESDLFYEYIQQYETHKRAFADEVSRDQRDMPLMVREVWFG